MNIREKQQLVLINHLLVPGRITRYHLLLSTLLASFALSAVANGQVTPFFENFDDGDVADGTPVTWLESLDNPLNRPFSVVNGQLVVSAADNDDGSLYVDEAVGSTGDVSVRSRLRMTRRLESGGIYARGDNGSYFAGVNSDGFLFLGDSDDDPPFVITEQSVVDPFSNVNLQIDVIGETVSATAWQDGLPMPAPQLSRPLSLVFLMTKPRGSPAQWVCL